MQRRCHEATAAAAVTAAAVAAAAHSSVALLSQQSLQLSMRKGDTLAEQADRAFAPVASPSSTAIRVKRQKPAVNRLVVSMMRVPSRASLALPPCLPSLELAALQRQWRVSKGSPAETRRSPPLVVSMMTLPSRDKVAAPPFLPSLNL